VIEMKVPLPNLDDRRWTDLVDEGRALIPVYAPDWTDHNVHDPGITLMELFAWIAEMDVYELDRVTDLHKRKFLELVGIKPRPSRASHTVLSFTLKEGVAPVSPVSLDEGVEFSTADPFGDDTRFRLIEPASISPGDLAVVQVKDKKGFNDQTTRRQRKEPLNLFGSNAERGTEFYLGFTKPFPISLPVRIYFKLGGGHSGFEDRLRLIEEQRDGSKPCPHASDCACHRSSHHDAAHANFEKVPPLNRVRLVWEVFVETSGSPAWKALSPGQHQIEDDTRSLTLDGGIVFGIPWTMAAQQLGHSRTPLYYIRCRLEAGSFDAPPVANSIILNAARAEQAVPATSTLIIKPGVVAQGSEPKPGDDVSITGQFDERGNVTAIQFDPPTESAPGFRVLEFIKATAAQAGALSIEAVRLGAGSGLPAQALELAPAPVVRASLKLYSQETPAWRSWHRVDDFLESTRRDAAFVLDEQNAKVIFGDGEHGRVLPKSASLFATYLATRAEKGNLSAYATFALVDSPLNRILVENFDSVLQALDLITNPIAAAGGSPPETLDLAIARAVDLIGSTTRAVTLKDYEELAKQTPGARVARAAARANLHASFPCFSAPGIVTVMVLPEMPGPRPTPAPGLLRDIATFLHGRRVLGTRVQVVAPRYLDVTVRTSVKALQGASKAAVQQKISDALNAFFNPLSGGPDKTGWPFGRDVFRSEVMQVIDEVEGVDHVVKLELVSDSCEPQCGNVCLAPIELVASGNHEISVV
jgi:baseplate J-like protein